MKARIAKVLFGTALAVTIAGCQTLQPIQNVKDAPVTTSSGKAPAAAQVRSAIITAGTSLGWRVADAGPGKLEATLNLRTHSAVVEIPYSARAFSIQHKRTENLNESGGQVHRNYNSWVQNLDRAIRTEISRL